MKTRNLIVTAGLVFSAFAVNAQDGEANFPSDHQKTFSLSQYLKSFSDNSQKDHWTDSLRKAPLAPRQEMGVEYGRSYGDTGAIRPASDALLGPVAIYFRATF